MNWDALSAWLYENSEPDYQKIRAHKIAVVYVDPRSTNAAEVIADLRAHGIVAGAYVSASWQSITASGSDFARWTSHVLTELLPKVGAEAPPCMVDIEKPRNTDWAVGFINAYRTFQPARPTAYTNEPFQGGLVPVAALGQHGFHWYPQLYYGDTLPDGRLRPADAAAVVLEAAREFPPGRVHPFYDGAALPADARGGCVFTLERIPA